MKKIILICLFTWISSVNAAVIEVSNSDSGWYKNSGEHVSSIENYIVGTIGTTIYHNFFVFDLGGISDSVTSATLQLFTSNVTASGTYSLFDVTTSIASLTAGGTGLLGTYDDLASGSFYGSIDILDNQDNQLIQIVLNNDALSDINLAGGLFAIGGVYSANGSNEFSFGSSQFNIDNKLILNAAVPVPAAVWLFGSGVVGLIGMRKRHQKKPVG